MTEQSPPPPETSATPKRPHAKWVCDSCGFVYDPADGDRYAGIAVDTPFTDLPEDWHCPECGADKDYFIR